MGLIQNRYKLIMLEKDVESKKKAQNFEDTERERKHFGTFPVTYWTSPR